MATKNTDIIKNQTISAPVISPVMTISGSTKSVSYSLSILCPLDTSALLTLEFQRSADGIAWEDFNQSQLAGGPITKGTNIGGQATALINGEVDNLNIGDELRINASVVSGTWVVSASITQN